MLGATQKAWFKNELLAAKGKYPLVFWVSSVPWIGNAGINYYPIYWNLSGFIHHTNRSQFIRNPALVDNGRPHDPEDQDFWGVFSYERAEIANFIRDNQIKGVAILHGDAHMLAADDGSHSDYATGGGAPVPGDGGRAARSIAIDQRRAVQPGRLQSTLGRRLLRLRAGAG
jgi:phosphodiesterase/alkaline phosphatase D-like protein